MPTVSVHHVRRQSWTIAGVRLGTPVLPTHQFHQRTARSNVVVPEFVGAIDQGTTSTRFMIFDHAGNEVGRHQLEHEQILPQAGLGRAQPGRDLGAHRRRCCRRALNRRELQRRRPGRAGHHQPARDRRGLGPHDRPAALQRDRLAGHPHRPDRRRRWTATAAATSSGARPGCRRPPTSPAGKIQWILENVDGVREAAESGDAIFGNTDTWLLWNLTGGPRGGVHVTDVTNASRTMLMDLETLDWDDELLAFFDIPRAMLPRDPAVLVARTVRRDAATGPLGGEVPLTGDLGDQQAATVGQVCFAPGEAKNTYGTGNFMLLNTGNELVRSRERAADHGLLPVRRRAPVYALEGSIAVTGSAVQWLRDQLGIISGAAESESLARQVEDNGGVYFVPAFSGSVRAVLALRRPRRDRRAVPVQHQRPPGAGHAGGDLLPEPRRRRGDGGRLRGAPRRAQGRRRHHRQRAVHADPGRRARRAVCKPVVAETTALGAAYAAGLAVGFWTIPTSCGRTGTRTSAGRRRGATSSAPPATPAGRRPSSARWTGWTS